MSSIVGKETCGDVEGSRGWSRGGLRPAPPRPQPPPTDRNRRTFESTKRVREERIDLVRIPSAWFFSGLVGGRCEQTSSSSGGGGRSRGSSSTSSLKVSDGLLLSRGFSLAGDTEDGGTRRANKDADVSPSDQRDVSDTLEKVESSSSSSSKRGGLTSWINAFSSDGVGGNEDEDEIEDENEADNGETDGEVVSGIDGDARVEASWLSQTGRATSWKGRGGNLVATAIYGPQAQEGGRLPCERRSGGDRRLGEQRRTALEIKSESEVGEPCRVGTSILGP
jgi:hypothetical protein